MSTPSAQRALLIIPCRNEAGRVRLVLEAVHDAYPAAEIVVIDDASTDSTRDEAVAAGARVLSHAVNLGYGSALETGYLYALRGDYDVVLQMDGDGQHLADQLPIILAPIVSGEADLVIGSRYLDGETAYHASFARRLGQRIFGWLVFAGTRRRFTDPTSGFQALNRRTVTLFATGLFPNDYPDADMLLTAHLAGLRVTEVPVRMQMRESGTSMHSGLSAWYYVIKMLLSMAIVFLNRRDLRREIEHVYSA